MDNNITEKTFTQEDVNKIVQERLAKERARNTEEITEKEKELDKRELQLNIRQTLAEKGLPAELMEAINCTDEETFKKSMGIIEKILEPYKKQNELESHRARFTTSINPAPQDTGLKDKIKSAMGLH